MADPVLCVLVAHASGSRVAETLRSLSQQTYTDIEVIAVALPGAEIAADGVHVVEVVAEPHTLGFPDAVRLGLERAGTPATYLLLLHDDVALDADAVRSMVELASSDPAIAAVGAKLVEWDAPDVLQEVGSGIDRFAVRRSHLDAGEIDHRQRDDTEDVVFCSDACLLVRTDAYAELGGLDEGAWPFYEDVDLCWRLRASGRRVVVATSARARHAAALSRGGRSLDLDLAEATERGRLRFMLKHFAPVGLAVLLPQVVISAMARVVAAAVRREFWKVRATVGAWSRVARELPRILRMRRTTSRQVDDRELLGLGARGALAERRSERAEWFDQASATAGRWAERGLALTREPVSWAGFAAAIAVAVLLRSVLLGGTFTLGELRPLPTLGEALSNMFARVRPEGLDPFAPATPGLVALGTLRSIVFRAPLAEKLVLLLPLVGAAIGGARIGEVLALGPRARRWLAVGAAVNPVTLTLLRDGNVGALVLWVGSLRLATSLLSPSIVGRAWQERVRFYARWAIGWALVAALHPPGLVWLAALGLALAAALHGDGHTERRLHSIAAGAGGALVLLAPWSIEWFTTRTPLVGRPGWLVLGGWTGLSGATLGAGWPLIAWLAVAFAGAYLVGLRRSTLAVAALGAAALLVGAGGAMPAETMLAATGGCALILVALVSRRISNELPAYELGARHALVVGGVAVLAGVWVLSAFIVAATGVRLREPPILATGGERTGRVLWLAESSGGLRSWTTLGFTSNLGAFPQPGGPPEELASEAVEAARDGRTHRLGGVLGLADVSHVVVLDEVAGRGLDQQADLAPLEVHEQAVVYRNDSWRGPVMLLTSVPAEPLTPRGLAGLVRAPRAVRVSGWPFGPISFEAPRDARGVVYVAAGPRRGLGIEGAKGTITPTGVHVDAELVSGTVELSPPGAWRWLVPIEIVLGLAVLLGWAAATYLSRPPLPRPAASFARDEATFGRAVLAAPLLALVAGAVLGWSGTAVAAGGPFLSAAWYCPPVGAGFRQMVGIANANDEDVEYQVRSDLTKPPEAEGLIALRSRETVKVESDQGAVVESYGHRLAVAADVQRSGNRDSSLCSSHARELNLFPEGGRAATRARPRLFERYIIFNPFADVARASVRFISPDEPPIVPPALQDVQVKAGSFVVVDPEEQFEPMLDLSTVVRVWQGRAIVARRLQTVEQISWSLGAQLADGGVLPRAVTQDAITAVIALNPFDETSRVTLVGAGSRGSIPEQRFDVPPTGRSTFELNALAPDARGLVVTVEASRPVAMESLVVPEERETVSLLPPLRPGRRWVIPIAEQRSLVLVNPNPRPVRVSIDRLGPGSSLGIVTVEPNRMQIVPLPGRSPFGVVVRSDAGPVTAAAVGAPGSIPGVPLP